MKFAIPEISWHNRDPVLSVDFQPKCEENGPTRLATGGTDTHVLIWYISKSEAGGVNLEVAADLTRHQKAVNVVRWSPNGQLLASGDDESIIFIWKQKFEKEPASNLDSEEQYKETWVIYKTLRGHMEDVLDLSWSSDSLHLASGSVDNKLLLWDVARGRYCSILSDHKGFVQGVCWDPKGQLIATASTDRTFRTFEVSSKKVSSRSSKAVLPFPAAHALHGLRLRLYHDDTLQTFYRRLQFSPDGLLIAVPAGKIEPEQGKMEGKPINAVYIYTRYSLKVPACVVPCGEPALVTRWSPRTYGARTGGPAPALPAPRRMLLAVGTRRSVLLYDTQQRTPLALISNIHYTRLTDLTWSPDGLTLVASSTDGFCSVITFAEGELGTPLPDDAEQTTPTGEPASMEVQADEQPKEKTPELATTKEKPQENKPKEKPEPKLTTPTIDSFIKFKAPSKTQKKTEPPKTPVKIDVLEETAMPSWSDNSSNEIIRPKDTEPMDVDKSAVVVIEDSEDIKLVYEETEGPTSTDTSPTTESVKAPSETSPEVPTRIPPKGPSSIPSIGPSKSISPKRPSSSNDTENTFMKTAKITDMKEVVQVKPTPSPKAPRRVNFVTLSSPKNKKKL